MLTKLGGEKVQKDRVGAQKKNSEGKRRKNGRETAEEEEGDVQLKHRRKHLPYHPQGYVACERETHSVCERERGRECIARRCKLARR